MHTRRIKTIFSAAIALIVVACGGSAGNLAGIGGSGFISSGSVSGFGSVFVNGVEFETDSATFDIDGDPGTQEDLAIGMIVQVSGTIDGTTGNATSISFDDELQGPVTALTVPDVDGQTRSFMVLGIKVIIDSSSTTFDIDIDIDNVLSGTIFDFDNINLDDNVNNVEVSGFFDSTGNLKATRVELKDIDFIENNSIAELEGIITNYVSDSDFKINGINVDASGLNVIREPDSLTLENDLRIEVEGTLDTAFTTITASKIEAEDNSIDDTSKFELEGLITDYKNDGDFKINEISVNASGLDVIRIPASLTLENDIRVEVEGAIVNGILVATEIELEGGPLKVHAKVTDVNAGGNTFEVTPNPISPQTIVITITTGTQLENDITEFDHPFTLDDLVANTDFVEVRGYDDGSGGITATEVQVKTPEGVLVQGIIQSGATPETIKVLGVEFTIDEPGETKFEGINDVNIGQIDFFMTVEFDKTLIKIEDNDPVNGIADEIEIESL